MWEYSKVRLELDNTYYSYIRKDILTLISINNVKKVLFKTLKKDQDWIIKINFKEEEKNAENN